MRIHGAGGAGPADSGHEVGAEKLDHAAPVAHATGPIDFAAWKTSSVRTSGDDAIIHGSFGKSRFGMFHVAAEDLEIEFAPQSAREPLRDVRALSPAEVKKLRGALSREADAGGPHAAALRKIVDEIDGFTSELRLEQHGSPLEKAKAEGAYTAKCMVQALPPAGVPGASANTADFDFKDDFGKDGKAKNKTAAAKLNAAIEWLVDRKKLSAVVKAIAAYTHPDPGDKSGRVVLAELGRAIAVNGTPAVKAAWKAAGG